MKGTAMLADHLDARSKEILAVWKAAVASDGDVPAARRLSHPELLDHIPALLDRLAERLRGHPADASGPAAAHGRLRWQQGYDIAEVVAELGHLRDGLRRATFQWARNRSLGLDTLEPLLGIIDEVLTDAIAESVRAYQEDRLEQTRTARAEAERHRAAAEEASRHKTRLLTTLSHDARTPLNAVVLSAHLLEMHVQGSDDPEVAECLRTIRHAVRNVLDLLEDLLNLTKIDAGALPAVVSRFELEPALHECLSSIEAQAHQKGLDCRLEPDGLVGLVIETDRAKLKQILSNLLSNALRYTERGRIRLLGDRTTRGITISVADTGVGIAPADQARIFDEFAMLDNPSRPTGEGTGLGLAICRRLAHLLKGTITLESTPGVGSTFTLTLPAKVVVGSGRLAVVPAAEAAEAPGGGLILVAEDHDSSRQVLARLLRRMGYRVLEADNGRDVLDLVGRERPLAVLMDVNMPVMDGIDATLALRADPALAGLPIFALTGDVSALNQRRIGQAGVAGYLAKPVTLEALSRVLGSLGPPATDGPPD
jgi:signal transduction histidine kinase/ActR/RegA family two-component response regulator